MAISDAASSAVAHWTLNEESGDRADSVGSNTLTDNNTVLFGTGKFGNAADFERNTAESLSIADNVALSMGDIDFMLRCWIKLESTGLVQFVVSKYQTSGNNREYQLRVTAGNLVRFTVSSAGTSATEVSVEATTFGELSADTWYLLHAGHDATNNLLVVSVNGVINTAAHSAGVADKESAFFVGADNAGALTFDGLMDDLVVLKNRILTSTEIAEDWNSGTGVAFADWAAASAAVTGTATETIDEDDVVAGGKTIILTLTGDTFVAAGTGPIGSTENTQALIDGISAATSPANGWNDEWRDKEVTTSVVRTSATVATITMSSQATLSGSYDISSQETITVTIPAAVLTGASPIVASPTFTVDPVAGGFIDNTTPILRNILC